MKVLVCGGRDYSDTLRVYKELDLIHNAHGTRIEILIQGSAPGADECARGWAAARGVHCAAVPAIWERYGKSAGPKRNAAMLALAPDLVLAFPGGKGTANMVMLARKACINVREVE